jgi:hypothetical protein
VAHEHLLRLAAFREVRRLADVNGDLTSRDLRADSPSKGGASPTVAAAVLREQAFGNEKLFVHPKLMRLLTRDSNAFEPYRVAAET